jgi:hypothetical protein
MMRWLSVAATVALVAGCAGAPPVPAQRFTDAEAEIKAAQEIGAENTPQGKLHLQNALDQLKEAKRLSKDEPGVAARKLDNAQAEAELAKSVTREQMTRAEADQAKAKLSAVENLPGTGGAQ